MNDLEMALRVAQKALTKQLELNPKSGLKIDAKNKMRYDKALLMMKRLDTFFRYKGTFSLGCCQECYKFSQKGHQSIYDCMGDCEGKTVTMYDTCDNINK